MSSCSIQSLEIPTDLLGSLHAYTGEIADHEGMAMAMQRDGYILLRDALDRQQVLAAREEVMERLHAVGEVAAPAIAGIATGTSCRQERVGDLGTFWRSVSQGMALRNVTHGKRLGRIMETFLGEASRPHDLHYLRPVTVGQGTDLHYDYPFFAGYSQRIYTCWVPLGDVAMVEGALVIVEGSQYFGDLLDPMREHDYGHDHSQETIQQIAYGKQNLVHPLTLCRQRNTRLLSCDFQAGDVLVFSPWVLHGSLDNQSPENRVRLSCDVRYQPRVDPITDARYFGAAPTGSKGGGYADMRGARPLA